ncbi:hypothetical protein BpHYR1_017318 [Brachionus plicatilis]|uniref:Uncharacterized protein n=1 Tax=Brachionus plicatilis TaxID=10195 RepID=A0A3M7QGI6_BRAPC|nr:hypothetical protein BpHYR1_017318 [Brachionus plicatilis]
MVNNQQFETQSEFSNLVNLYKKKKIRKSKKKKLPLPCKNFRGILAHVDSKWSEQEEEYFGYRELGLGQNSLVNGNKVFRALDPADLVDASTMVNECSMPSVVDYEQLPSPKGSD